MLSGMSDANLEMEASPGLSWGIGSYLFERAFGNLAWGLKWLFWGTVLVLGGFVLIPALPPVAMTALGVGWLVLLVGEQRCLHLKLPLGMTRSLPGQLWLRAAYACHLAGILARFAVRF